MRKKANLSTREKQTLEIVRNNTNNATVEAVGELNELINVTSNVLDTLYFQSIRKGQVDQKDVTAIIRAFESQVNNAIEAVETATAKKVRVIETPESVKVK